MMKLETKYRFDGRIRGSECKKGDDTGCLVFFQCLSISPQIKFQALWIRPLKSPDFDSLHGVLACGTPFACRRAQDHLVVQVLPQEKLYINLFHRTPALKKIYSCSLHQAC